MPTDKPEIIAAEDSGDFAAVAAREFIKATGHIAAPLVVFPAGNTPLGLYRELVANYADKALWKVLSYLSLDEYAGLAPEDSRLFANWIRRELLTPLGTPRENHIAFNSSAANKDQECARMEMWLAENGPIDIALLGLGMNGHIGFNEPGSMFDSRSRLVTLTDTSIEANAEYWGGRDQVPPTAFTLGIGTLAQAKRTILLVNGAKKADILKRVLTGPITPEVPATYLRLIPNVTIIADKAALGK
jgi:glucosamine-6-phosphate deaminase